MDRNTLFGGNPLGVIIRLTLLSIAVGIVFKALGIDLDNFFDRMHQLMRNVWDLGFGTIEWEFATIASTFAGLPLISMGLFGLLAAGMALPSTRLVVTAALLMLLLAAGIIAGFVVFLTDAPIALASVPETVALGIRKAIAKTTLLAVAFALAYLVAAISALRHLNAKRNWSNA